MAEVISNKDAVDALQSNCCACEKPKRKGMSHCRACYFSLPPRLRSALYKPVFGGYAEAYTESLAWLKAKSEEAEVPELQPVVDSTSE